MALISIIHYFNILTRNSISVAGILISVYHPNPSVIKRNKEKDFTLLYSFHNFVLKNHDLWKHIINETKPPNIHNILYLSIFVLR